ncbi:MAG: ABC transporter substrate-binding protein [Austwickia sp.]|jgi:branched-chain amino acid transport system substrate-binding protein|nr:ABC transporter substrate-binding protein [Austwickia sp.]MBK9101130.1 ABC transporter substrate-binding protein [Austwickia sp.]
MRHPVSRTALLAVTAAGALLASSCGGGAAGGGGGGGGGDAKGPIKVGVLADLTGATGDVGAPYHEGMMAYVDWVNSKGGIEGRKIEAMANDYAYKVPQAEELYKKYVSGNAVAIQGWGTGDSEALRTKVSSDKLPFMSASYAEVLTDPTKSPYNFVVAPTYSDQMRVALNWIAKDAGGAQAEVAVFHNDSPFGMAPVADGQTWIKEKGLKLGYKSYAMPKTPNFVGLLSQAQAQKAKYIVIQNVSSPAAQVAKDIKAQNLGMKIVCLNWCADELFIKTATPAAAEGHIMVQPFAPPSAPKPGHQAIEDYLKTKGSSLADKGLHYAQGWYTMHVMAEGMAKTLKDGKDLTGENIKASLESMSPVDTGGVVGTGQVKFSADSHRGSTGSGIYQVKGGKLVELAANQVP